MKSLTEHLLAWKFMRKCAIVHLDGKRTVLTRNIIIKDLFSLGCYSLKELKSLSLPDLVYEYVAQSSGGTEVYDKATGKDYYVGYS